MITLFIVFQCILVCAICVAVLLQKSSSIGLGAYSGSNESLFGAKGPAGFLAKATFFLGLLLICNTVTLSYLYNKNQNADSVANKSSSLIPTLEQNTTNTLAPLAPAAPTLPTVPSAEENSTK